mmetsp:Transcript_20717/g.66704  ORF Transcript_20717/g.66704 Transcript_20717/m.66704 type:complete len:220 (-) Transcript_20717:369-1028(-)
MDPSRSRRRSGSTPYTPLARRRAVTAPVSPVRGVPGFAAPEQLSMFFGSVLTPSAARCPGTRWASPSTASLAACPPSSPGTATPRSSTAAWRWRRLWAGSRLPTATSSTAFSRASLASSSRTWAPTRSLRGSRCPPRARCRCCSPSGRSRSRRRRWSRTTSEEASPAASRSCATRSSPPSASLESTMARLRSSWRRRAAPSKAFGRRNSSPSSRTGGSP